MTAADGEQRRDGAATAAQDADLATLAALADGFDLDAAAGPAEVARRVVRAEAAGLARLAGALEARLDGVFVEAVERIAGAAGRTVVSGMGKSGHVGGKIAATLASTGTPAQFVHPAEASHGDLGMLTAADVALVLSNSGETAEIFSLLEHCKRFGIPLIGVASRGDSTLIRQADVGIVLPPAAEACPMGLAPTTSTTMALALGDALAVALMVRRAFTAQDFRVFHPGGALGARLLRVSQLMHVGDALPIVTAPSPMAETLLEMTAKSFGVAGVVDADGALIGVVTDGDLRRNMDGLTARRAGEVATRAPKTIGPDALAAEALGMMNQWKISSLFVIDHPERARPVGLIHIHDCLRAGLR